MRHKMPVLTSLALIASVQIISPAFARKAPECGSVFIFKLDPVCGGDSSWTSNVRDRKQCDESGRWQTNSDTVPSGGPDFKTWHVTSTFTADWGPQRIGTCTTSWRAGCRRPEFGIEDFLDCDIKKTTGELNEYISQNKISISNDGKDLLQFQSNYYSEEKNQTAFGCLISRYQEDLIYSGVSSALVTQFENLFSRSYSATEYSSTTCAAPQVSTLQSASCADSDSSSRCANLRRYQENLHLLQTKKAEILDLKNDVVPRQNAAYAAELDALVSMMPLEVRN